MFHTRLNNFPVFRNYHDIDFALRSMDVLATQSNINELEFYVKFCEIKAEDFKATFLILLANVGVGDIEKF